MKIYFQHPTAIIDEDVTIGEGTHIWAFVHVCRGARIGKNCTLGEGVYVGPHVVIGDECKIQNHALLYEGVEVENNVFIGPGVVTTNDLFPEAQGVWSKNNFRPTLIKKNSSIGANTTLICGITIGERCLIGAGSVVTKEIPAGSLAYGNPARVKQTAPPKERKE